MTREPRLMLLNEPFAAVDQMNRQGLYRLLTDLRRKLSVPIVPVTHELYEARMLAVTPKPSHGGNACKRHFLHHHALREGGRGGRFIQVIKP